MAQLSYAQFNGAGSGTSDDPYIILNADQFYSIRNFQNSDTYFSIINDIDLSDYAYGSGWEPIPSFRGNIEGNGHKITGLFINKSSSDYVGLFGTTYRAVIKNLIVEGNVTGNNYVGGIAGASKSSIDNIIEYENVHFYGTINGNKYVGGIAGYDKPNDGYSSLGYVIEYHRCKFSGVISGVDYVGGIVGYGFSTITNSSVFATISANQYVGGVSGISHRPIEDCYVSVNISTTSDFVGGISGYGISRIKKCSVNGSIASIGDKIGGVIGYVTCSEHTYGNVDISDSYFMGYLKAHDYVGGIVGYNGGAFWRDSYGRCWGYVRILNNYAKATIIGHDKVGGILSGYTSTNDPIVTSNVCMCPYIECETENVGRIQAREGATPQSCYSLYTTKVFVGGIRVDDAEIQANNKLHGTDVGEKNLKTITFYQGLSWDFGSTWAIINTECIPYLQTQTAPPIIQTSLISGETHISGNSINGGAIKVCIDESKYSALTKNNVWDITVPGLQSGTRVIANAYVDNLFPSYDIEKYVSYLGAGTQLDPYLIKTPCDLANIHGEGYYKLTNNIDLDSLLSVTSSEGWQPLGVYAENITYLDGDNHKISNLFISKEENFVGLFASLTDATIKNLIIETAPCKNVHGIDNVGVLAGRLNNCTIENVTIKGNVCGNHNVGGLAGIINGGSINSIKVTESSIVGKDNIGGIAGGSSATTILCAFSGNVLDNVDENENVSSTVYIGGLFATSKGDISQSFTEGSVTATRTGSRAGGLVGDNYAPISNCYAISNVNGDTYAAGIAANNHSIISNCYASGDISTFNKNSQTVSCGIIGYNEGESAAVSQCFAMNKHITSCSDVGNVFRIIGGIKNNAPIPGRTNLTIQDMVLSVNGVRLSQSDDPFNGYVRSNDMFKTQSLYENNGWNFNEIWSINSKYPYLSHNKPNKKEQTISMATIENRKYGDESFTLPEMTEQGQAVTWSSSDAAIVNINGQTATILKAGDVTLTATSEETNEYMDFSKDYTVSIAKAKLKISAQNCTRYMGDDNPEFTVIYSGFVNNDNAGVLSALPVVTTTANHNSPVGEYTISVSGAMAENYDIEYANGTLTIIDKMDSIMASTNKLELKDFTAYTNKQVIMPIELKNENEITGVQFKLVLPEGISVALNNKQKLMVNKTERSSEHTIGRSIETDGIYTILLHSTELDVFAGTEGSIVDITLDIDKDLAIGEYTVTLSDIVLSTPDAVKIKPNDITGKINVKRCQTGDPNNDGDIDVTDIIAIANYILGREMQNEFFVEAADVDGDGVIDVNDIVGIANIILFGNTPSKIAGAKGIYASEINNDYLLLTQKDNGQVTVNLKSHQHYTSFQMDIRVPDNTNIENIIMNCSDDHVMNYARLDNGYYRILVYSVSNNDLSNNDGTLLTLIGNGLTTDGITLENVTFSNSSLQKFQLPWRTESTTGLQGISETLLDKPMDIYTVNGKLIRKGVSSTKGLKKGLYIIGKKTVTIE